MKFPVIFRGASEVVTIELDVTREQYKKFLDIADADGKVSFEGDKVIVDRPIDVRKENWRQE